MDNLPHWLMGLAFGVVAKLFAHLTPDQIAVAAEYHHDGLTQVEIAERRQIGQATVHRYLTAFASTCERLNIPVPVRPQVDTRHTRNISPALMRSL